MSSTATILTNQTQLLYDVLTVLHRLEIITLHVQYVHTYTNVVSVGTYSPVQYEPPILEIQFSTYG